MQIGRPDATCLAVHRDDAVGHADSPVRRMAPRSHFTSSRNPAGRAPHGSSDGNSPSERRPSHSTAPPTTWATPMARAAHTTPPTARNEAAAVVSEVATWLGGSHRLASRDWSAALGESHPRRHHHDESQQGRCKAEREIVVGGRLQERAEHEGPGHRQATATSVGRRRLRVSTAEARSVPSTKAGSITMPIPASTSAMPCTV